LQYFNIPVDTNFSSASNPLSILKQVTLPTDFVSVKIDIDAPMVEQALIEQVIETGASGLI
jgi:hypothetical protein